jgi:HNH endonuclease
LITKSLSERLHKYITKEDNSCWVWSGTYSNYSPVTTVNKKSVLVRKIIYGMYKKKPSGDYLISICKNKKCVNPYHLMSRDEILFSKIIKNKKTGCWEWIGTKKRGYGYMKINGKDKAIHRLLYERYKGKILSEMNVCHTCDNPSCCNPDHLWLGTQTQNIHDCVEKKRDNKRKGETHLRTKITEKQAIEIKIQYRNGIKPTVICRLMNIPYSTVYKICINENWKHIEP